MPMVYEMPIWQLSVFPGLSVAVHELNLVWFDSPICKRCSVCPSIFVSGARTAGPIRTGDVPFDAPERRRGDGAICEAIGALWYVLPIAPPNLSRICSLVWPERKAFFAFFYKGMRDRTWYVAPIAPQMAPSYLRRSGASNRTLPYSIGLDVRVRNSSGTKMFRRTE